MTRELKFRAWDKLEKEMFPDLEGKNKKNTYVSLNSFFRTSDNFILMQFTGLLDKNGKEIYKGDIVELTLFDANDNDTQYICEVKFEKGGFILCCDELEESFINFTYIEQEQLKVIRNIYENPELLK